MPETYWTSRSNPSPKPAWGTVHISLDLDTTTIPALKLRCLAEDPARRAVPLFGFLHYFAYSGHEDIHCSDCFFVII